MDRRLLPDMTILDGLHTELYIDDNMSYERIEARLRNYIDCDDPVIVITTSQTRKQEILKRCDFLSDALLACTVAEALAEEVILVDCRGNEYILRRAMEKRRLSSGKSAMETQETEQVRETTRTGLIGHDPSS